MELPEVPNCIFSSGRPFSKSCLSSRSKDIVPSPYHKNLVLYQLPRLKLARCKDIFRSSVPKVLSNPIECVSFLSCFLIIALFITYCSLLPNVHLSKLMLKSWSSY